MFNFFKKKQEQQKTEVKKDQDFNICISYSEDGLFVETNVYNSSKETANIFSEVIIGMTRGVFFPTIHQYLQIWSAGDETKKEFCNIIVENINKEINRLNEEEIEEDSLCVHPEDVFNITRKKEG